MADKDDHGDRSSEDESFLESEEDEVDYKVGGYHRVAVGGKPLQMFTYTPFRIVSPSAPPSRTFGSIHSLLQRNLRKDSTR